MHPSPDSLRLYRPENGPFDVLIVDDHRDPDGADSMALLLEQEGLRTQVIRSLAEAVRTAKESLPRLILIDTESSERVEELRELCRPPLAPSWWTIRASRLQEMHFTEGGWETAYEVAVQLRRDCRLDATPLVAITNYDEYQPGVVRREKAAGFDARLLKGSVDVQTTEAVRRLLRGAEPPRRRWA